MRVLSALVLACVLLSEAGCGRKTFDGVPTVDAFTGRLTYEGQPITVSEDAPMNLKVIHEKGTSFGIPLQSDGTFKIGWMPIGKYGVVLDMSNPGGKGKTVYTVPGGFTIEAGKTEYAIELGKDWPRGKKKG